MSDAANSVDFQQRRGAGWDVVDEALEAFRNFMLDDDYDYQRVLYTIMSRMEARRDLYNSS